MLDPITFREDPRFELVYFKYQKFFLFRDFLCYYGRFTHNDFTSEINERVLFWSFLVMELLKLRVLFDVIKFQDNLSRFIKCDGLRDIIKCKVNWINPHLLVNVFSSIVLYFEAFILDDMQSCINDLAHIFGEVFMESDVKDWQINVICTLEQARFVQDQIFWVWARWVICIACEDWARLFLHWQFWRRFYWETLVRRFLRFLLFLYFC